jgi:hypothetical protein
VNVRRKTYAALRTEGCVAIRSLPAFLSSQALNVIVAIALFALLWVVNWRHADFLGILVYSIVAGSVTLVAMRQLTPIFARLPVFYHWVVYLCLLFLVALAGSTVAVVVIMLVFRIPFTEFAAELWSSGRLGTLVITLVGILYDLYGQSRSALEQRNLELQQSVDVAQTHSEQQSRWGRGLLPWLPLRGTEAGAEPNT